jgi:hypothetical protein
MEKSDLPEVIAAIGLDIAKSVFQVHELMRPDTHMTTRNYPQSLSGKSGPSISVPAGCRASDQPGTRSSRPPWRASSCPLVKRLALPLGNRQRNFGIRSWNKSRPSVIYHAECNSDFGDKTMFKNGKAALIVAITLSVLGAASTAFAGGKDDDGSGHDRWEGKVAPSGQVFSTGQVQSGWIGQSSNAFAQSPAPTHLDHGHRKLSR